MTQERPNLYRPEFPKSNEYEPDWVINNQMGPNALWLVEWLSSEMDLKPGMRVLDLGCGTAMTSIFLAREFDVQVWAVDLWTDQDDNWKRIREAGVRDKVYPLRAEAHSLPFAAEFFDAVVSMDSYHYFGTDELYMGYISRFLRAGGKIGIAVPGLMKPFERGIPEHLTRKQSNGASFWEDDCISFFTAKRWRDLWDRSNRVTVTVADTLPDGWRHWRDFENVIEQAGKNIFPSLAETLDADRGQYIGFVRVIAVRKEGDVPFNMYDPALVARLEAGHGGT